MLFSEILRMAALFLHKNLMSNIKIFGTKTLDRLSN